jgi:hypothetical protein
MLIRFDTRTKYIYQGIDKISFAIHPLLVNSAKQGIYKFYDSQKKITIRKNRQSVIVDIHAEYFDYALDIYTQIARAVLQLIYDGIILFPINGNTWSLILSNLNWILWDIKTLEFFFDFKLSDFDMDVDENNPEIPDDKKVFIDKFGTKYSKDLSRKNHRSRICIYDREKKQLKTNQAPKALVIADPYKMRLEFRLSNENCRYLNLDNLHGSYQEVFERFKQYLAILYMKYVKNTLEIRSEKYSNFKKLVKEVNTGRKRNRGELVVTTIKKDEYEILDRLMKIRLMNQNEEIA